MVKKLISTDNQISSLILRIFLGAVIFAHGAQKLFGIWGGHGVYGTIEDWEKYFQLPGYLTFVVIIIESIGALLLILGLFTRVMAFLIGCVMFGAVFMLHIKVGFYMNWYGTQVGEGFEYHILVVGMVVSLIISGGGRFSLDRSLFQTLKNI